VPGVPLVGGETKVLGRFLVMGLLVSSTMSLAGSGGQLLTPKTPAPMKLRNQVQWKFLSYKRRRGS